LPVLKLFPEIFRRIFLRWLCSPRCFSIRAILASRRECVGQSMVKSHQRRRRADLRSDAHGHTSPFLRLADRAGGGQCLLDSQQTFALDGCELTAPLVPRNFSGMERHMQLWVGTGGSCGECLPRIRRVRSSGAAVAVNRSRSKAGNDTGGGGPGLCAHGHV
jgi:hypothetical protein